jgi:hypothetical protein
MRFHNPHSHAIGPFSIAGNEYRVAPGTEVDVPDHHAGIGKSRGLNLICKEPERLAALIISQLPPAPKVDEYVPAEPEDDGPESVVVDIPEAMEAKNAVEDVVRQLEEAGVQIPSVKKRGRKTAKSKG